MSALCTNLTGVTGPGFPVCSSLCHHGFPLGSPVSSCCSPANLLAICLRTQHFNTAVRCYKIITQKYAKRMVFFFSIKKQQIRQSICDSRMIYSCTNAMFWLPILSDTLEALPPSSISQWSHLLSIFPLDLVKFCILHSEHQLIIFLNNATKKSEPNSSPKRKPYLCQFFCLARITQVITNLQAWDYLKLFIPVTIHTLKKDEGTKVVSYPQLKWCALQISSEAHCMKFSEEGTEYAYY